MAESQAKIRLTLDGQQAIQEGDRLRGKMKGIADQAGEIGKQFFRSIAGVTALAMMLDRAADASKRIREETAEANRSRGGAALTRGQAGRALKATGGVLQAYQNIQEGGAVGEDEQLAFMSALAKSGGKRVQGAGGLEYAKAFATGAFSQEELLDAAKGGKKVDIAGRLASLSDSEKDEIALRVYELEQTRRTAGGQSERLALIERARQRRDNPGLSAFVEGVEGAPIIGGLVREAGMERLSDQFGEGKLGGQRASPVRVTVMNQKPQTGAKGEQ